MIKVPNIFQNKKVAVLGLGIEGRDAIKYLSGCGAVITLLDKKSEPELDFSGIDTGKIQVKTGENYLEDIGKFDYIVRSPGIYRYDKDLVNAEKLGVKITSSVKIFFNECPAKIIGVTGTKGKGTTSTLIYEILKNSGKNAYLAGNIGKPYLELLPQLTPEDFVVMELSSFQLIDLGKGPDIAVVLNITEDHMDWHKDIKEYIDAKRNIVLNQSADGYAVINSDYSVPKSFADGIKSRAVFFSVKNLEEDYKKDLLLRGNHNLENIAAAVAVSKLLGIDGNIIKNTLQNFKGLEHRLEMVRTVNDRTFYNDSFATGPQPTIAAVNSFTEPETLILGGSDKGLEYKSLARHLAKKKNVKNIILIGSVREQIKSDLINAKFKGNVIDLGTGTMSEIVKKAYEITNPGGVVILSPSAASFDMFKNYKDRGTQFKESVNRLLA